MRYLPAFSFSDAASTTQLNADFRLSLDFFFNSEKKKMTISDSLFSSLFSTLLILAIIALISFGLTHTCVCLPIAQSHTE